MKHLENIRALVYERRHNEALSLSSGPVAFVYTVGHQSQVWRSAARVSTGTSYGFARGGRGDGNRLYAGGNDLSRGWGDGDGDVDVPGGGPGYRALGWEA